ncbi:MAG: hypothetical protein ABL878_09795 [Burkholderiales bacterium]
MHTNREVKVARSGAAWDRPRWLEFKVAAIRLLLLWMMAVFAAHAVAQDDETSSRKMAWQNAGAYSYHFDRDTNYREDNIGMGAELAYSADNSLMAGTLINSQRARTRYLGLQWRPVHGWVGNVQVHAGVAIAAMDGYPKMREGGWFPGLLPLLAVEGRYVGLNLSMVPTIPNRMDGAVLIQLKLRVW